MSTLETLVVTAVLTGAAAVILAVFVAAVRRGQPDEPAPVAYVPQHDIDTIELRRVGAGYWPVIGQARINAALGDTQQIERIEVSA